MEEKSGAALALALQEKGIPWDVVSLEKDGAIIASPEGLYRRYTFDLPVVSTVGCRDSMAAVFVVALLRESSVTETIQLALAVSAANALLLRIGWFRQEDLELLVSQVSVEKYRIGLPGPRVKRWL